MPDGPRAIIVHAAVGTGHRLAGESIRDACLGLFGDSVEFGTHDILELCVVPLPARLAPYAFTGATAGVYDRLWGRAGGGAALTRSSRVLARTAFPRFQRLLADPSVRVAVFTHALPAMLAAPFSRSGLTRIAVLTDFMPHAYWPTVGVERYCVPCDQAAEEFARRGVPLERVSVTGVPIRERFGSPAPRDHTRAELGIPADAFVALVVGGGDQRGAYARMLAVVPEMLANPMLADVRFLVLTGKDAALHARLRSLAESRPNVTPVAYTEAVPDLMAAADVMVCKPGGLVTSECLAAGLPMALVGRAVGQERANLEHHLHAGTALAAREPGDLIALLGGLAADPSSLLPMREACAREGRRESASAIAEIVAGEFGGDGS